MATLSLVHKAYIGDTNIYVYAVGVDKLNPELCVIEKGHYRRLPYQVAVVANLQSAKAWIDNQSGSGKRGSW